MRLEVDPGEDWVRVRTVTDGVFTAPPTVTIVEGTGRTTLVMTRVDAGVFSGWFRPDSGFRGGRRITAEAAVDGRPTVTSEEMDIYPILPGTSGSLELDGGRLIIRHDSTSLLRPLYLRWSKSVQPDETVYSLQPVRAVLGDGLSVTCTDTSAEKRRALFFRPRGRWELIGGAGNDRLTGSVTGTLGDLSVMTDQTPPAVSMITIKPVHSRKPTIRFHFADDLAGVEYEELKTYIDHVIVIPELDGEHRRAVYQVATPLSSPVPTS
jgi:hypothetical protein